MEKWKDKLFERFSISHEELDWLLFNATEVSFGPNTTIVDEQEIDTQYITSEKKDIKKNICRIVEQAYSCGFFDDYIRRFEYTYNCFNRGNEMIEQEVESQEALASVS